MTIHHEAPKIDSWYRDPKHHLDFEVVAIDENENTIEIQYFEGEIEELTKEDWYEMELYAIPPPKDWTGPFELENDLLSEINDETIHPHIENPLKFIE